MASTCASGTRCHVNGKGLKTWGTAFPWKMVQQTSSSSVTLVTGGRRLASGTLVWSNVVLCAAHTLENQDEKSFSVWLHHECDAKTAQGGHRGKRADPKRGWADCALFADKPQAKVVQILELDQQIDYAFVRITWNDVVESSSGTQSVKFKRVLHIPNAGRELGKEVLLVGHPQDEEQGQCEPAQASAGTIKVERGPHLFTLRGAEYSYANFSAAFGMSGGGVFNTRGEIVGMLLGSRPSSATPPTGPAFLNLAAVAGLDRTNAQGKPVPASLRIRQWMGGAPPLMANEEASLK